MRELPFALSIALGYLAFAAVWIVVSGQVAFEQATDAESLARFELMKGLFFVSLSSGLIFLISWVQGRKVRLETERLSAAQEALLLAESRATTGLFAASMAHDAANMVGVILPNLELAEELTQEEAEPRAVLAEARRAAERLAALCARLQTAGRNAVAHERRPVHLDRVIAETVRLARSHHRVRKAKVEATRLEPVEVLASPGLLQHVLLNLLLNAAAASAQGRIEVQVRREGEEAVLEVHDDGPGIPPEHRAQVFEPFHTSRQEGTGLGLFSVLTAARQHEGEVEVDDSPLGGACLRVRLPLRPGAQAGGGAAGAGYDGGSLAGVS